VVPDRVKNFAFIGQFAESTRDCIFTTEYSVRTGMTAAYQLLNIERGIPEVFGSIYDVRELIKSTAFLRDREKLSIPLFVKKYVEKTIIGKLLKTMELFEAAISNSFPVTPTLH
jgi:oleate hydratase